MEPLADLRELFLIDDGSLPEIRVGGLDSESVRRAVALVHSLARQPPKYAHADGRNAPPGLDHFVLTLTVDGCQLPELGFGAFQDALIVDYRMGPGWTTDRIDGLFDILHRICTLHQGAYVEIEPEANPELRRLFQKAWLRYLTRKGAA